MTIAPPEISIVIPVYNSVDCLGPLTTQLGEILRRAGRAFELVLVDDASADGSWERIRGLAAPGGQVTGLRMMRNVGQPAATLCGLQHARGGIVVTMDDDLQHRPDQLPRLLDALERDPDLDCVFGCFPDKKHGGHQKLGSAVVRWLTARAYGVPSGTSYSSFRAMRRRLVDALLAYETRTPVVSALIFSASGRTKVVEVEHAERLSGRSGYSLAKQIRVALDSIVSASMLPLRAMAAVGFGACVLSVLLASVVLVRYLHGQITVPGWTTVVIAVSFFSGAILFSLGIIGEYLVRVLREVRGYPRYVIRERITPASGGPPQADGRPAPPASGAGR